MEEIVKTQNEETEIVPEMTLENRLEIIEEGMHKNYLARLGEMEIVPVGRLAPLEEDLIDNVRLYRITEMVYKKGERATDKFATVFNTLSTYNASVFIIIDSDGINTEFYIGVRNNEADEAEKRSSVTLGDTLKNTLIGHFPGVKIENKNRTEIASLSNKIAMQHNAASVSVVGSDKIADNRANEQFVQGLEKLALAMEGRQYLGIIIAQSQSPKQIQSLRREYQELYTRLSPLQKVQFSTNESSSTSRSQSFQEMNRAQKAAMIGNAAVSVAGAAWGLLSGAKLAGGLLKNGKLNQAAVTGSMLRMQLAGSVTGQLNSFISSLAPTEQMTKTKGTSTSTTTENKAITDLLQLIDEELKRVKEFESYGLWNAAGYFVSDDMAAAEIAASNYRSLMNGETSGREVSAINSWRSSNASLNGRFEDLTAYLSRFVHPRFYYGLSENGAVYTDASTTISGKELGLHLGLPRATVSGLPVIEHAEFGKEVTTYQLFSDRKQLRPEERMTLGRVFDLGQITNKIVELENKSLNMHTFITGSTGSGKSNTVYQMLNELYQDKIPFLVVEPAKGEYKDVFGHFEDVNVYSTNPNIAELINLNPFKFPDSIHVLEHVDGLVEIFSVCWPMYDAMPAFFKDAILKSYEAVGWDLGSSTFEGREIEYPDFEVLAEQLTELIENSDYASDIKSNYRGALITRVRSLTVGLNKFIFTTNQTPYEKLFDENCILDISRVKSSETKALLMGLMVYILNEYRMDKKTASNNGLKHITVLEEAHNLLKNTQGDSENNLVGKSVEMITQTIAEIRTYGEGFIIVDQSPSSVDIAAIKNTNTKIVLRTPEANDREAVGRSMGLTENQVNEIAKLPSGVAVVYQNNWVTPVLTLVDKARVEEIPYVNPNPIQIRSVRTARTDIIYCLMQPWLEHERYRKKILLQDVETLDVDRKTKKILQKYIDDYAFLGGKMIWREEEIDILQKLLKDVMGISNIEFLRILEHNSANELRDAVRNRTLGFELKEIDEICNVLTKVNERNEYN